MNGYLDLVEHYQKVLEKRNEWTFKVNSTFLTVTSAMLAVIVSLSNFSSDNLYSKILLATAVLLDILCILFSSILIYENKVESDKSAHICYSRIEEYIHGDVSFDTLSLHKGRLRGKLFLACEKLSYISFLLFIIVLTTYALCKIFLHAEGSGGYPDQQIDWDFTFQEVCRLIN